MRREVSVSLVLGRVSRLMYPPGNLPAALVRSRYSTWSGKKSTPSRTLPSTAAVRTMVSPKRTTTEPSACLASLQVSRLRVEAPNAHSTRVHCPELSSHWLRQESRRPGERSQESGIRSPGSEKAHRPLTPDTCPLVTCEVPASG